MAAAWELVPDLIGLAIFAFVYALLWVLTALLAVAFGGLNAVLGWVPGFGGLQRRLAQDVHDACENLLHGVAKGMVWTLNGIVDSLALVFGVTALFALAVWELLTRLDETLLAPAIRVAVNGLHTLIGPLPHGYSTVTGWVAAEAKALRGDLTDLIGTLPRGYSTVTGWVAHEVAGLKTDLANLYRLDVKPIEDELAATIRPELKALGKEAAQLEAAVVGAAGEAAAVLPHLPELSWDEVQKLLANKDLQKLAGLLAAIPLLDALLRTLVREAGLDKAECRAKTKQICGTDPLAWEKLLVGAAFMTGALSLAELVALARAIFHASEDLIRQAA